MKRTCRDDIADILGSINETREFTLGMDRAAFAGDKKTINAVVRSLEVMGEAAKRVPDDTRARYPQIPWKQMSGMRDKLIHEYSGVDVDTVWKAVKEELPSVLPLVAEMLESPDIS